MDTPIEELTFEDALKELERIVGRLESGEATLDESIRLYERGDRLRQRCAERLDAGQRYTVDRASVGEDFGHELPNFEPLSGRQVAVWVSVELNGYEPRDFARSVGIAPSTARTHLQRARERMGGNR